MNFKPRVVRKAKKTELNRNGETIKVHTKPWNSKQTNRRIESPVESPICGEVKLLVHTQTIPLAR